MIRIAITPAASIAASLPLGSVGYEPQLDRQGQHPGYRDGEHTVKRNGGEVLRWI